jgi:peptidylprolyl isomerase
LNFISGVQDDGCLRQASIRTLEKNGKMAQVKEGDTITLHYTGALDDGTIFDSSEGRRPLSFKVGTGQVIPGFDEGVRGMEVGERKQINIPADQAYGQYYEELVKVVPRQAFPPDVTPAIGLGFEFDLPSGESMPVRIIDVEGDDITLDANHLLAGEALNFDVHLVSIDNE